MKVVVALDKVSTRVLVLGFRQSNVDSPGSSLGVLTKLIDACSRVLVSSKYLLQGSSSSYTLQSQVFARYTT